MILDHHTISDMSSIIIISIAISYIISFLSCSFFVFSSHLSSHINFFPTYQFPYFSFHISYLLSHSRFWSCEQIVILSSPTISLFLQTERKRRKNKQLQLLHSFPREKNSKVNHSEYAFVHTRHRCQSRYPRCLA